MLSLPLSHCEHHALILRTGADAPVCAQVRAHVGTFDGSSVYLAACCRIVGQRRLHGAEAYEVQLLPSGRRRVVMASSVRACQGLDGRCICAGEA